MLYGDLEKVLIVPRCYAGGTWLSNEGAGKGWKKEVIFELVLFALKFVPELLIGR